MGMLSVNGLLKKWRLRTKWSEKPALSVNHHHNGQKFTDKSPENDGLSVKCVLLTDKSAKNSALSVNSSEILVRCPEQEKIRTITGTDFHHYSVVAFGSTPCIIRFQLAFPLSQARTPWTRRARLRSSKACVRAHDRSLPHLVLIRLRPATRLMISSCRVATALSLIARAPPYLPSC